MWHEIVSPWHFANGFIRQQAGSKIWTLDSLDKEPPGKLSTRLYFIFSASLYATFYYIWPPLNKAKIFLPWQKGCWHFGPLLNNLSLPGRQYAGLSIHNTNWSCCNNNSLIYVVFVEVHLSEAGPHSGERIVAKYPGLYQQIKHIESVHP